MVVNLISKIGGIVTDRILWQQQAGACSISGEAYLDLLPPLDPQIGSYPPPMPPASGGSPSLGCCHKPHLRLRCTCRLLRANELDSLYAACTGGRRQERAGASGFWRRYRPLEYASTSASSAHPMISHRPGVRVCKRACSLVSSASASQQQTATRPGRNRPCWPMPSRTAHGRS